MAETSPVNLLADVLSATGEAHHHAYAATDGADPEWALWYAAHLQPTLGAMIRREDVTQAEIVWALVDAERRPGPGEEAWPVAYAQRMLELVAPGLC